MPAIKGFQRKQCGSRWAAIALAVALLLCVCLLGTAPPARADAGASQATAAPTKPAKAQHWWSWTATAAKDIVAVVGFALLAAAVLAFFGWLAALALLHCHLTRDTRVADWLTPTDLAVTALDDSATDKKMGAAVASLIRGRIHPQAKGNPKVVTGHASVSESLKPLAEISDETKAAAGLFAFFLERLPDRHFEVSGALNAEGMRGRGISLSLTNHGDQLDAITLWASEFSAPDDDEKGFQFLAVPAAAWIEHRVADRLDNAAHYPDPKAWLRFNAGLAWQEAGDPAKAKTLYEEALDADPTDTGSLTNLGLIELNAGNSTRSEALLERGRESLRGRKPETLEVNPDWYRVRYNLATLHANLDASRRESDPPSAERHRFKARDLAEELAEGSLELLALGRGKVSEPLRRLLQNAILPSVLSIYGGCGPTGRDDTAGGGFAWSRGDVAGDQRSLLRFLGEGLEPRSALEYVWQHALCRPDVLYNLACGWAQFGDAARAKEILGEALDRSSPSERKTLAEGAWADDGFDPLRAAGELEDFEALLAIPRLRLSQLRPRPDPTPAPPLPSET